MERDLSWAFRPVARPLPAFLVWSLAFLVRPEGQKRTVGFRSATICLSAMGNDVRTHQIELNQ